MTTQEIKDLIASKIAGQGSMVDIGGALPTILDAIVDMASNVPFVTLPNTGKIDEQTLLELQDAVAVKVTGRGTSCRLAATPIALYNYIQTNHIPEGAAIETMFGKNVYINTDGSPDSGSFLVVYNGEGGFYTEWIEI